MKRLALFNQFEKVKVASNMRSFLRAIVFRQFASRKRGARTSNIQIEEASPEQVVELNKQKTEMERMNKISSVKGRTQREPEEALEKEIFNMIGKGMTDQEIIGKLEFQVKNQQENEPKRQISKKRRVSSAEDQFKKMLDEVGFARANDSLKNQSDAVDHQRALIELMKKTTKQRINPTNAKQFISDASQSEMAREFIIQQRVLDMVQKQADPKTLKLVDEDDVTSYLISPQIRQKAVEYQENQLKYFSDLIIDHNQYQKRWNKRFYQEEEDIPQNPLEKIRRQQNNFSLKKQYASAIEPYEEKKQRLLKEYQHFVKPSDNDIKFKQQGKIDLQNTRQSSIFLDEQGVIFDTKLQKTQSERNRQIRRAQQKQNELQQLGVDAQLHELVASQKQHLLEEKKFLEQQQIFKYNLLKREKMKEIKKLNYKINKDKLADDINFKQPQKIKGFNLKNRNIFGIPDIEQINQINQKYARSQFNGSKQQIDHAYIRTQKNMEEWLNYQLTAVNTAHRILHRIHIHQISYNDSLTVMNVTWAPRPIINQNSSFRFQKLNKDHISLKQIQNIQAVLKEASLTLSAKMCQELGLRYGPDIRFSYFNQPANTNMLRQELLRQMPEIIRTKIQQEREKGKLPKKMKIKEFQNMITDIEDQYTSKVEEVKAEDESEGDEQSPKKQRKHKKQPSQKRKKAVQRFWDQL